MEELVNTSIWQLHHFRWKSKIWYSANWMLKKGNQMGPLGSAISWWGKERSPGLKHCLPLGMGDLLTGVPIPQCSSHVAGRDGEDHQKIPPISTNWDSHSNKPCTPLCQDSSAVHWQSDTGQHRTVVPGRVCACPKWTPLLAAGRVHDGATTGAELVHG